MRRRTHQIMSESTEETAHGTDATVLLKGAFASKIFHKRKNYDREIQAFQHLGNCKFVVPLISSEPSALTLVFPRYRTDLLRALTEGHTEVCAVACCRGLLAAIRHCHELNVVHRDVKLDNILLDDSSNPVLCDFSRSLMVTEPSAVHFEGTLCSARSFGRWYMLEKQRYMVCCCCVLLLGRRTLSLFVYRRNSRRRRGHVYLY